MKNRAGRIIAAVFALLLLLLPTLLCIFGFALPAQYSETFLGVLPDKIQRLRQAEGPRIIVVGGSSIPFSVKSQLMEQALPGYQVVDFGLYADLGTPVMLDWLEEELREGDIVIISPEQDPQALSDYYSAESLWQAVDGSFSLLGQLSSERYEKLAAAFPVFAGKKCYYAIHGAPQPTDIYARSSFNTYTDIQSPLRAANIMAGGYDPNQRISFADTVISSEFIGILNDFAAICQEKGASIYYRFGPMNQDALEAATADQVDEYYDFLRQQLSFPIMGDPNRSIMESGWFYDTNFHLNDSGATVFTKYLIEDLKILFKDTSPTLIALPDMPQLAIPAPITGDDSCQDCFTYRRLGDGWVIDGLSEKGLTAQALVVPVSYQGQVVTGIDEGVFAGNTTLQEVTLQLNIGILYDGMFQGCTHLERLILTSQSPSAHTVGDGLLEGADFLICVPEDSVDQYRRHYSWQQYSAYIIADPDTQ